MVLTTVWLLSWANHTKPAYIRNVNKKRKFQGREGKGYIAVPACGSVKTFEEAPPRGRSEYQELCNALHGSQLKRHIGSKEPLVPSNAKQEQKELEGIWRLNGSTQLHNLAVR
eukprot:scaffold118724_cov19-Tisochrysis_lutea.AAC.1